VWPNVFSRATAPATSNGEKRARSPKQEKAKQSQATNGNGHTAQQEANPDSRTVTFPIRPDFDVAITLPRSGLTVQELKKLVYFLLPYANDWEPSESPRNVFKMLEGDEARA
jgi:hypothetical protein